jgi:PHD-finger
MVCCDRCDSWQHNECMEIPLDDEELGDSYLCEVCEPANHKALLEKVANGIRPWEERARLREEESKKKKGKKGGKKGKAAPKGQRGSSVNSSMVDGEDVVPKTEPTEAMEAPAGKKRKLDKSASREVDTKSPDQVSPIHNSSSQTNAKLAK